MFDALDLIYTLSHFIIIFFNIVGPFFERMRKFSFLFQVLTLFSWIGLGFFFGFGYCPLTDWHWDHKRHLGETELPASFIKYIFDELSGLNWNPMAIDIATGFTFASALIYNVRHLFFKAKKNLIRQMCECKLIIRYFFSLYKILKIFLV